MINPMSSAIAHRQQGFSLVEVILFMVVVSVALISLVQAFNLANVGSADPVLRRQSLAIAQGLLDEISFKDFENPAGGYSGTAGDPNEFERSQFDDLMDYHGFEQTGIRTLDNTLVTGLENYAVSVEVADDTINTDPSTPAKRIRVTVTDPANRELVLETYRANYD
jgi:MSHA pilin protein MshD